MKFTGRLGRGHGIGGRASTSPIKRADAKRKIKIKPSQWRLAAGLDPQLAHLLGYPGTEANNEDAFRSSLPIHAPGPSGAHGAATYSAVGVEASAAQCPDSEMQFTSQDSFDDGPDLPYHPSREPYSPFLAYTRSEKNTSNWQALLPALEGPYIEFCRLYYGKPRHNISSTIIHTCALCAVNSSTLPHTDDPFRSSLTQAIQWSSLLRLKLKGRLDTFLQETENVLASKLDGSTSFPKAADGSELPSATPDALSADASAPSPFNADSSASDHVAFSIPNQPP
ncbi:unnamed protein product [Mycena citricolor]|uniref:Uncharacterized protein n=1 Tax=Mycena citricolor TaxID=2018698 RepID=A0AAD2H7T2_9AGAR|nr:unnamed protein product [Mycena citricolor]